MRWKKPSGADRQVPHGDADYIVELLALSPVVALSAGAMAELSADMLVSFAVSIADMSLVVPSMVPTEFISVTSELSVVCSVFLPQAVTASPAATRRISVFVRVIGTPSSDSKAQRNWYWLATTLIFYIGVGRIEKFVREMRRSWLLARHLPVPCLPKCQVVSSS